MKRTGNTFKRITAILIVLVMVMTLVPAVAAQPAAETLPQRHCCMARDRGRGGAPEAFDAPSLSPNAPHIVWGDWTYDIALENDVEIEVNLGIGAEAATDIDNLELGYWDWFTGGPEEWVSIGSLIPGTDFSFDMTSVLTIYGDWFAAHVDEWTWELNFGLEFNDSASVLHLFSVSVIDSTPPAPGRILVSPANWDDIGLVLQEMDLEFTQMTFVQWHFLNDLEFISEYEILFVNCGTWMNPYVARAFVAQGGLLYASDLTLGNFVKEAFPEQGFTSSYADPQEAIGHVALPEHRGLEVQLGSDRIDINFESDGWQYVTGWTGATVDVLIRGAVNGVGSFPFTLSFEHGAGAVYFTSFHHSEQMTDDMSALLTYIINNLDLFPYVQAGEGLAQELGFDLYSPIFGTLAEGDSEDFAFVAQAGEDFAVLNAPELGNFVVTLTDPNGQEYVSTGPDSEIEALSLGLSLMEVTTLADNRGFVVRNAVAGTWNINVELVDALEPSTFVIGIATIAPEEAPGNGGGGGGFTVPPAPPETPPIATYRFTDVNSDNWFYEAVMFVYENDIMQGTGATTFAPNATLSRAMVATILHRLEGAPEGDASHGFGDVAEGTWYADAVAWAYENGIVQGITSDSFAPHAPITREQFATMLYRYAEFAELDTEVSEDANLDDFTDADQISAWAEEAMLWANYHGLITGRTATTIVPDGTATRAEAATILMRLMETF